MYLCPPDSQYHLKLLCIDTWKNGCLYIALCLWPSHPNFCCPCVAVCVCHSHPASVHTPWSECVHTPVHEFMSTWLSMSAPLPMHSLMESWVLLYGTVFVSQVTSFLFPTPCLECVHASVHDFMSTWLSMSAPPPMYSYRETWVSQCGTVCVAVIPLLFAHTG